MWDLQRKLGRSQAVFCARSSKVISQSFNLQSYAKESVKSAYRNSIEFIGLMCYIPMSNIHVLTILTIVWNLYAIASLTRLQQNDNMHIIRRDCHKWMTTFNASISLNFHYLNFRFSSKSSPLLILSCFRGLSQYGLLHFGQTFGFSSSRGTHLWLHRSQTKPLSVISPIILSIQLWYITIDNILIGNLKYYPAVYYHQVYMQSQNMR